MPELSRSGATVAPDEGLQGMVLWPPKSAPALTLRNYTGRRVSLAKMRGSVGFVTFVYTHCHDVCPLIVAELAAAQRHLGPWRRHVHIIAVTVDPRGDTPRAVKSFLAARGALGRMYYLIGPRARMLPVWRAWDIGVSIGGKKVTVGHTAIVYGITASGRIAVVYPSTFDPEEIVHDAKHLARM